MNRNETSYLAAVRYARRHIESCCYGRPCLEDCLRRLGASLPPCACAGGWRPPRWAKWLALAAALALLLLAGLRAHAAVQCVWEEVTGTYICSGEGSQVTVIGGGDGDVVITNIVGVCTNCVAMSPQYVKDFKADAFNELSLIDILSRRIEFDALTMSDDLGELVHAPDGLEYYTDPVFSGSSLASINHFVTNYIAGIDDQNLVKQSYNSALTVGSPPTGSTTENRYKVIIWNGALSYANQVSPVASSAARQADDIERNAHEINLVSGRLFTMVDGLSEEECTNQWDGANNGGGSGVTTNSLSGNWCTYDQGEAIKELLADLKEWGRQAVARLTAISNFTEQTVHTLRSGLFSDHTAIPEQTDWQTVYLQGQPTGWGYDPTNILQRIEVLLYGISGISTNSPSLEDTTPSADDAIDDIDDAVATIRTDADDTAATTLGNAVLDFFRAFTPNTADYRGGEEIIAEVSIKVGDDTHYVPSMRLGESGFLVDTMNAVKICVNGFCCVIFWIGGAFAIFRFWAWFSAWCIRLSKWAVELCTSLFAS